MNTVQLFFLKIPTTYRYLLLINTMALGLYFSRVVYTQDLFYGFLVWNLFLAFIPLALSFLMRRRLHQKATNLELFFWGIIWLLFFPNAPYIITDFIHIHLHPSPVIWLDLCLVFTFALAGLLLGVQSLQMIHHILKNKLHKKTTRIVFYALPFLAGFGVYLGRFLRFNSWDIVHQPLHIIKMSLLSLGNLHAWLITLTIGFILLFSYFLFQRKTYF